MPISAILAASCWSQPPIPIPKACEREVLEILDSHFAAGKYEQSCASYRSRVFAVEKKSGKLRLVHDLQPLNAITIRDAALPPRPDDFAESFAGRVIYGVADLFSGYDARTLDVRSRDLTTFQCMNVSARCTVLPQGATNAVSDFVRCTRHILAPEIPQHADAFLDDCGIKGGDDDYGDALMPGSSEIRHFVYEYCTTLDRVFLRFITAGVTASGWKLIVATPSVDIVGSHVSRDGWHLLHGIATKIANWPYPSNVTEVRSFLGLAGVGRRWIRNFALIARPLTVLCRSSSDPFLFTEAARAAVDELKRRVSSAPVLRSIDYDAARAIRPPIATPLDGLVVVGIDSSIYGAGWVLSQYFGIERHPALFGSCTFSATESRYSQPKCELYGVFRALKELRSRVWGTHFLLEGDAKFLEQMLKEPDLPNAPMTRWVAYLQLFDFTFRHIPAERGQAQDALSRRRPAPDDSDESDGEAHLDEFFGRTGILKPLATRPWPIHLAADPEPSLARTVLAACFADMSSSSQIIGRDSSTSSPELMSGVHGVTHLGSFVFEDDVDTDTSEDVLVSVEPSRLVDVVFKVVLNVLASVVLCAVPVEDDVVAAAHGSSSSADNMHRIAVVHVRRPLQYCRHLL